MRNTLAMYLAIFAGVMLLGAGVTGAATWQTIRNFVLALLGDHWALVLLFQALLVIASLGGIAVIFGGALIGLGRTSVGKLFILLGTGVGLLGLLIAIALPGLQQGSTALALGTGTGVVGVLLSIAARTIAK
ncbi:MAG: hypothetical protein QMD95_03670 [Candidatus Hodarchaeaceae archaeon]|nr:hypothetical protein [Candidatus Hodarchaeaceae archaeon]